MAKPKPIPDENSRNIEEMVIPQDKKDEVLNELRHILWNGTP